MFGACCDELALRVLRTKGSGHLLSGLFGLRVSLKPSERQSRRLCELSIRGLQFGQPRGKMTESADFSEPFRTDLDQHCERYF